MKAKITKDVAAQFKLGKDDNALEPFGLDTSRFGYGTKDAVLDLGKLSTKKLVGLAALVETKADHKGVKTLQRDVTTWLASMQNPDKAKGRSVEQAANILRQFILKHVPNQRVFQADPNNPGNWLCFYVGSVVYHPASKGRGDDYTPPSVSIKTFYEERGTRHYGYDKLGADQCQGKTALDMLKAAGLVPETDDLRAHYLAERELFQRTIPQIGAVYAATGTATAAGVDGNPEKSKWDSDLDMEKGGDPSRVVLDVFYEDKRDRDSEEPDPAYWQRVKDGNIDIDDDDDEADPDDDVAINPIEVPLHPYVIVFDLARHLRVSIHLNQLATHQFDTHLADKLVLSQERKELVKLLVDTKAGGFTDIVKGKAGGAVVLLAGPPGTGKTLTAEVYAESEGRALYSVQCSQLGIDPDDLEGALLKVFERARRWNAVLLLDEADVYVRQRSNDLMQNAIVGVFLRVLEYQATVMFLTTNRPDDVDDAIASRCIAKLSYERPTTDELTRIWEVLTMAQGLTVKADVIGKIVAQHQELSGRDVKNLIKLAKLRGDITAESIAFVKQFKPTSSRVVV